MTVGNMINSIAERSSSSDKKSVVYLLGSHAQGNSTEKSDVDILIFHRNKEALAKQISKSLKSEYKDLIHKLDVKILNHKELNKIRNDQYFYFYSMLKFGICTIGNPIHLKLHSHLLERDYKRLREELRKCNTDLYDKRDFTTTGALIFAIGKSLRFMERVITDECKSLKEIFGSELILLGRLYEQKTRKNKRIQTTLTQEIVSNGKAKSKGKFSKLLRVTQDLEAYAIRISFLLDQLIEST